MAQSNQCSEADLAYQLLQQNGQAMYYRDLIISALEATGRKVYSLAPAIAEVHTQINMDSRFMHVGKGMWGLTEWTPRTQNQTREDDLVVVKVETSDKRRSRLFEEIQQEYISADIEISESE